MDSSKTQAPQEAKLHFLDYWRIIRIRKTVIIAVFLLVVITATLVTLVLPQYFSSVARIRVERDQTDISGVSSPAGMLGPGYDPYFIQTEFEVIKSDTILSNAITEYNASRPVREDDLQHVWGAKRIEAGKALTTSETIRQLNGALRLSPVRNTSLIEIQIILEDANQAARLANSIAVAYQKHRKEQRTQRTMSGIDALELSWKEQVEEVEKAQKEVEKLRVELKVPDSFVHENAPSVMFSMETLRSFETERIQARAEYVRQATMLKMLKEYSLDQLAQAIPTAAPDLQLSSLLEQRVIAEQKLVSLKTEFGEQYSEVQKASGLVEDLQTKIKERVNGILLGLEARVASLGQGLTNLTQEVESAKQNDIELASKTRPYFDAKRKLDELQGFQRAIRAKMLVEKTDVTLPRNSMVEIVDLATPGLRPVKPNRTLNIVLGIIIGLVVGVGLAFFIEYLDTSVKTIDDVERTLGSPVLGVIPQNVGILLDEGAESPHAEAYRVLRTNLLFSRKDDKLNAIAVVSAGAGEGKSTTVFNLAAVFAQSGQRVIVVDSDLRRPTLHKMVRVTNNIGLTNYLLKQNTLEEVIQTTSLPTLDFMASGKLPSSSLGILSSAQMKDLITELKQHYDYVFFDSPPVMGVSDASILASEVDMTIQVIQYRRYPQPMNIRAKQLIEKVGGNLVGIVLNNINMSQDESYYYYSGYYHEYYSRDEEQEPGSGERSPGEKGKSA